MKILSRRSNLGLVAIAIIFPPAFLCQQVSESVYKRVIFSQVPVHSGPWVIMLCRSRDTERLCPLLWLMYSRAIHKPDTMVANFGFGFE